MSKSQEQYEFTPRQAYITAELGEELLQTPIGKEETRWDYIKELEGIDQSLEELAAEDKATHLLCLYNGLYPELNEMDADYSAKELCQKLIEIYGFDESMGEDPFDEQRTVTELQSGPVKASTEQQIAKALEDMTAFDEYKIGKGSHIQGHYDQSFGEAVFPGAEIEKSWGWIAIDTDLAER